MKRAVQTFVLGVALFTAAACADTAPAIQANVAKDIALMERSLTLAENVADIYAKLPRCGSRKATVLCSDKNLVDRLASLDRDAYNLVSRARTDQALISAAAQAISAFEAALPSQAH